METEKIWWIYKGKLITKLKSIAYYIKDPVKTNVYDHIFCV